MNKVTIQSLLLPFYFGAIKDQDRIIVERELLTDSEVLVDYLDLKRNIEAAEEFPRVPSKVLWFRLKKYIEPKKKTVFSVTFGAVIAAAVLICWVFLTKSKYDFEPNLKSNEILFDSRNELPVNSNVL